MEHWHTANKITWKKRLPPLLLVVFGIAIAAYPWLNARYEDYRQLQLLTQWKQGLAVLAVPEEAPSSSQQISPDVVGPPTEQALENPSSNPELSKDFLALLKIPSIDLELPVLRGATKENLRYTAATIEPTGSPGETGNFAVAGHNYHGYGRNFNRLDEIVVGDQLQLELPQKNYTYLVTQVFCVNPEETQVLAGDGEKSLITLITCFPRDTATQRLIIRGELQQP